MITAASLAPGSKVKDPLVSFTSIPSVFNIQENLLLIKKYNLYKSNLLIGRILEHSL